jgi:hypothetical protein
LIPQVMVVLLAVLPGLAATTDDLDIKSLEQTYQPDIRPLLAHYCHKCHAEDRTEADIDFTQFPTWAEVRKHPQIWQKVGEMLDSGQMPPKKAQQPSDAERTRLQQWVHSYLAAEAKTQAGDPGRVVLRRLSNTQYTYTLRDLTGLDSLDPAREFPSDGAAGEGFTNTGNALVMSPALVTKYLAAAKEVAGHVVLLPNGFRFSTHTTPRDWTEETLAQIREFYRAFTDPRGGDKVNLQGIVFDTNQGGRLPLEQYLAATISGRESLTSGSKTIDTLARENQLNAKYLATLWQSLTSHQPSLLLDILRAQWRQAKPVDAAALAELISAWQRGLWKFTTVGHIGKAGGPKSWLEPVTPLLAQQELRFKVPAPPGAQQVTLSLITSDAGDGHEHDFVIWQRPRFVSPGRPDLLLCDIRQVSHELTEQRQRVFALTARYLAAATEAAAAPSQWNAQELVQKHALDLEALSAWLDYLGIGSSSTVALGERFTHKLHGVAGYDFIQGWGRNETPFLLANSAEQHVRIPGNMKPHSVAVHPSPTLRVAAGWVSPVTATLQVNATVTHAHPECGNGVTWSLEHRRGGIRRRLASGIAHGGNEVKINQTDPLPVHTGDCICLSVGARDGSHACDLTAIALTLATTTGSRRTWDLAHDVSANILAGNPHPDRYGNPVVWQFYTEPDHGANEVVPAIPGGSLLARWQLARSTELKHKLAHDIQTLLISGPPIARDDPDAALYRQLASLGGPLFGRMLRIRASKLSGKESLVATSTPRSTPGQEQYGLDPILFGNQSTDRLADCTSLYVRAPSVLTFHVPAELVAGSELVTTGMLDPQSGALGSVQLNVVTGRPVPQSGLLPSQVMVTTANGQWTANNQRITYDTPIIVNANSTTRKRIESAFDDFRRLFPAALCYTKIVPVDEVVTLTLFYREDDHLARLMLSDAQRAHLNRLWDQLHFISQDALTLVDAFAQLMEYATQDADPKVFEPLRKPINDRAAAFKKLLKNVEPKHLNALVEFAAQAYRRPLDSAEVQELHDLYGRLRKQGISHDRAFRLVLARVLVAPAFLYRVEKPVPGLVQGPVSDRELASRLSYFLWATQPDEELYQVAAAGQLHQPDVLLQQTQRMLRDPKTRRLAIEFACQWLHILDFDHLDEKSERHFPTFLSLQAAMYEESIQFFTDLFRNNGSVLDILNADYTFLNRQLANHYAIPFNTVVRTGTEPTTANLGVDWHRVDGVKQYGRGGILAQATTLAKQSGASRTSPILRGNWISEVLLGERLPRPPKGVPVLPDDEAATEGLTVRQLVEKHAKDTKCAVCHRRIDPLGFSLEAFDAIGRRRDRDLAGRPIDTHAQTIDGAQFDGLDGLRTYLLTLKRDAFIRQFCRKLLGYALGRSVQLSDELLLNEMQSELKANNYHIAPVIGAITHSRQFREIRGRDSAYNE